MPIAQEGGQVHAASANYQLPARRAVTHEIRGDAYVLGERELRFEIGVFLSGSNELLRGFEFDTPIVSE